MLADAMGRISGTSDSSRGGFDQIVATANNKYYCVYNDGGINYFYSKSNPYVGIRGGYYGYNAPNGTFGYVVDNEFVELSSSYGSQAAHTQQ